MSKRDDAKLAKLIDNEECESVCEPCNADMDVVGTDMIKRVRALNDRLRRTFCRRHGRVVLTAGVDAFPAEIEGLILEEVRHFNKFDLDNDPYAEHDFGRFEIEGHKFFWKIDYYTSALDGRSENPADPDKTTRVLTIMRADEY